jgi:uncharacterized membrane protein YphA (DoxX/SURF4 family)
MRLDLILPNLPMLFATLFIAILFIQSGLDKVFNFSGNKEWLTGHFGKTFLAGMVPMMLATLTVMEVATGLLAAVGLVYFLVAGSAFLIFLTSIIGAVTFIALFFGQRLAQDYPGAAVLVPYFILDLIVMSLAYSTTYAR